jgi:hypothetical protein
MNRIVLPIIVCLLAGRTIAQNFSQIFGNVSIEELEMTHCPIDSLADAFILHDRGGTEFITEGEEILFKYTRHTRLKILSRSAYDRGEIEIPYYHEGNKREKIFNIRAVAYNLENGDIVISKLNKDLIFVEDVNEHWRLMKFAIPDVKEGSVIEIKYSIESPWKVQLRDWKFQEKIPSLYNSYKIEIIPFFEYHLLMNKFLEFDLDTVFVKENGFFYYGNYYAVKVYKWVMTDVPAFKDEAFITTIDDYIQKVEFQLSKVISSYGLERDYMSSWEEVLKNMLIDPYYSERFGNYIESKSAKNKKIIKEIGLHPSNTLHNIRKLLNYTKSNYKWNGIDGIYASQPKKDFLTQKSGAAPDLNLFFLSLLRSADIEAYPVLISTRKNGKIFYEYPFLRNFNYVVVAAVVGELAILLDATDPFLTYNLLPRKCLNEYGLKADVMNEVQWYPVIEQIPTKKTTTYLINYNPLSDSIESQYISKMTGYYAQLYRGTFDRDSYDGVKDLLQHKNQKVRIKDVRIKNALNPDTMLIITCSLKAQSNRISDKLIIKPLLINSLESNPLKFKERHYPLSLDNTRERKSVSNIKIPDNYEIEYLPESGQYIASDNSVVFTFHVEVNGNYIQVLSEQKINSRIFSAEQYPQIQDYFQKIVDKHNEVIVLKKIKEQAD